MVSKARNPQRNKQDIFDGENPAIKKPVRDRRNPAQRAQQRAGGRVAGKSNKLAEGGGEAAKADRVAGRQELEV